MFVFVSRKPPFYIIEEDVKSSTRPYCQMCKTSGWSNHYISKKRYHFLIPNEENLKFPLAEGLFDDRTHTLHGLIHCNGFGHLLCINGVEGGSEVFGRNMMDLWDQLCTVLGARKVTVLDSSKKRSMELRLLFGIAFRHTWFGRWDYKFFHGGSMVKEEEYTSSIELLRCLSLESIIRDFEKIKDIVWGYRDQCQTKLITLGDLLSFMITIKTQPGHAKAKNKRAVNFDTLSAKTSRWGWDKVLGEAMKIVDELKRLVAHSSTGAVSRKVLRSSLVKQSCNSGLVDHVLKLLDNVIIGNNVVKRERGCDGSFEYTVTCVEYPGASSSSSSSSSPQELDVYDDLIFLYHNVLVGYPAEPCELASQILRRTSVFVKEWGVNTNILEKLRIVASFEHQRLYEPIKELIYVSPFSTVGELKTAIESAFKETYFAMEKCKVLGIDELQGLEDGEALEGKVKSEAELRVRVIGVELEGSLRHQGGEEARMVNCKCGSRVEGDDLELAKLLRPRHQPAI